MSISETVGAVARSEWPAALRASAVTVFEMMVGAKLGPVSTVGSDSAASVTGTVGIAGAMRAIFSFRCSTEAARKIASGMLCVSVEQADPQKWDAIGEISNMIAGEFKARIGMEAQCMLSVPTVVAGHDYRLHCPSQAERIELDFSYKEETVLVTLEIRK
jgi:chemotaxis protein CheX